MPNVAGAYYWQPVFKEFTALVPNTVIFAGSWPGSLPQYRGTFEVRPVRGVRFITFGKGGPGYPKGFTLALPTILWQLGRLRPSVVLTSGLNLWSAFTLLFKRITKCRVVLIWEGVSPSIAGLNSPLRLAVRRIMAKEFDAAISNTRAGVQYLRDVLGMPSDRVVHHPIEVAEAPALKPGNGDLPVDRHDASFAFLVVGQLIERKGIHRLFEAARLLQDRGVHDFTIHIVGTGEMAGTLQRQIAGSQLDKAVRWIGPVSYEKLGGCYEACDAVVFPSLEDTWGMVVLEAMCLGRPVLCSKYAGSKEMIQDGENGFVFDPHNPAELADRMELLLRVPGLAQRLGEKAKEIIGPYTARLAAQVLAQVATGCGRLDSPYVASEGLQGAFRRRVGSGRKSTAHCLTAKRHAIRRRKIGRRPSHRGRIYLWIVVPLALFGYLAFSELVQFSSHFNHSGLVLIAGALLGIPVLVALGIALRQGLSHASTLVSSLKWWHWLWAMLLFGALTFRIRGASEIASEPLDAWAVFRIAIDMLVAFVLLVRLTLRRTHWPGSMLRGVVGVLTVYGLVCLASTAWSVFPPWTLYKSWEYLIDIALVAAILESVNSTEDLRSLFNWTWTLYGVLLLSVWKDVLLFPQESLHGETLQQGAALGVRLDGVIPAMSSNDVGTFSAIIALISLARLFPSTGRRSHTSWYVVLLAGSLVTLVLAQTRSAIIGCDVWRLRHSAVFETRKAWGATDIRCGAHRGALHHGWTYLVVPRARPDRGTTRHPEQSRSMVGFRLANLPRAAAHRVWCLCRRPLRGTGEIGSRPHLDHA